MGSVESIYLFQLARDRSPAGRKVFAKEISGVFLEHYPSLTREERALMFDILHQLVHDVDMRLRAVVSEHIAKLPDVPRNLARILANDAIEVAFPILSMSDALLDQDLIEVIRNRTIEHQLAITERSSISGQVADSLVGAGDDDVICSLLKNTNADISSATMEYLVEESKRISAYQEPILHRADLAPELAERMFRWVSTALRQYILDNYDLDQAHVDEILENAVLDEILSASSQEKRHRAPGKLTAALDEDGAVTPELMVDALGTGEVRLFTALFRRLTGIRESTVMEMLFELEGKGLAIGCKAAGLNKVVFHSIFVLSRKGREQALETLRRDLRGLLTLYDAMTRETARKVVNLWQRDVDYLAAIRELELD